MIEIMAKRAYKFETQSMMGEHGTNLGVISSPLQPCFFVGAPGQVDDQSHHLCALPLLHHSTAASFPHPFRHPVSIQVAIVSVSSSLRQAW